MNLVDFALAFFMLCHRFHRLHLPISPSRGFIPGALSLPAACGVVMDTSPAFFSSAFHIRHRFFHRRLSGLFPGCQPSHQSGHVSLAGADAGFVSPAYARRWAAHYIDQPESDDGVDRRVAAGGVRATVALVACHDICRRIFGLHLFGRLLLLQA